MPIGTGTFSTVQEVEVLEARCAAKQLLRLKDEKLCYKRLEVVYTNLWQPKIEHTNLVRFVGVWFSSGAVLPQLVYEKMDICLAKFLKTNREQKVLLSILRDVFCGLKFLHQILRHEKPLVHGELTANSVFVNERSLVAKIGDLGVCEILGKGVCPSPSCSSYKSPESYKSDHVPQVADDLYASGVLIIHTLLQKYPESQKHHNDPERFSAYSEQLTIKKHPLHACIAACLNGPSERPPAAAILAAVEKDMTPSLQQAVVSLHMLKL